ncbi:glycosyltransferase family A protein [Paracoccus sanguinis]|uniref:Glycosyltransferase 2-like domain-containing protein n=1 Tax=Paracoccus sanguinis TaxID=1545044 RepID=A0A099GF10_9RHOB|nr:glycosyltransferase family A protein [Paracoccus sanguinis]KGJ21152.1 hypothetical protein IX56_12635 [Paracoccus sanguinis]
MVAVSLIIPAFNAAGFLDATLRSVSQQDLADFECLVVDDFSSDDTLTIAKAWRARDRRIRIITQRARSGVSAARNAGLRAARGALCAFLDADDLLMRDSLRLRLLAWQRASRAAGSEAAWRIAGSYCSSETIPEDLMQAPRSRPTTLSPIGFATIGGRCPFNANQPMIRRDVLLEMGGFNEAMSQAEDYDLWSRILRGGYWFVPSPQVAVTYRTRAGSAVRKAPSHHLRASLALHDAGEQALGPGVLSRSQGRLVQPHSHYAHQATKAGRILQFCGMELGSDDARLPEEIAGIIAQHLPDLPDVLPPTTLTRNLLAAGITRQTTRPPAEEEEARITELLKALAERRLAGGERGDASDTDSGSPAPAPFGPFGDTDRDRLWHPHRQGAIDVLFLPHKDYHTWTIGLAAPALQAAGMQFAVIDISPQWREAGVTGKAEEMGLPVIRYGEVALGAFAPRLIVAFNDWDFVTRPILVAAEQAGISTAAIVEGIQDYHDADTGRTRHAYRTARTVLLPGDFDRRYFPADGGQTLSVVGIPRIQLLRRQAADRSPTERTLQAASRRVLINSNFSHNVLTEQRDAWLTQAVAAVRRAGFEPVISRHPEDKGILFPELVTQASFYEALESCCASVQRFASGILESLAGDVPVIYFNPHGELVDKFSSNPMDAYPVALTEEALADCLTTLTDWRDRALARADVFLDHHAGRQDIDSGVAIAEGLREAMGPRPDAEALARFRRNLRIIDQQTEALTRREMIFDDPTTAIARMAALADADTPPEQLFAALADAGAPPEVLVASLPEAGLSASSKVRRLRGGVAWRSRMAMHNRLERAYRASARWPWLHRLARRAGEYYHRNLSPL